MKVARAAEVLPCFVYSTLLQATLTTDHQIPFLKYKHTINYKAEEVTREERSIVRVGAQVYHFNYDRAQPLSDWYPAQINCLTSVFFLFVHVMPK